ncbi:cilia- and flagella-associated protein 46-like isoform X3 [Lineus longissimus]|uniref:cilia- and flagella-associated protein 46-like isoform X3 n=1 Tax=Lineus longissimus TaxID=88925 RepID=UPI00315D51BA
MDANIRSLLSSAQNSGAGGDEAVQPLQQAYELLKSYAENRLVVDSPDAFSSDLYVLCAEVAFQIELPDIAKECLKMYFMKTPPSNQFLCRAYLCQAQLLAPANANNPEQLEKAVIYLVKAINFAKDNPRYHFLVYNASVLYWQFCRPFLKPRYRQYLAQSLHQVVKALDDIDDKDYEWRAQLMIALIECHMDAGRQGDAAHIATAASTFIKQHVPSLYKEVFGLMVRHQLVDSQKFHKDIRSNPELNIYYKICKLKLAIELKDPEVHILTELNRILLHITKGEEPPRLTATTPSRKGAGTPTRGIIDGESATPRRLPENLTKAQLPSISDESPDSSQSLPSGTFIRRTSSLGLKRTRTRVGSLTESTMVFDPKFPGRPNLLLELARLCLDQEQPDMCKQCIESLKDCITMDQGFYLEVEFLQAELMVKKLADKQESYQKAAVEVRLQAIKRCEEALQNAIRQGNPNVIQAGCVTQWNLCLPLTQSNLRQHVRKPLTMVADGLEEIQSLLVLLRCQVHTELAKCEEDEEQIEVAMEHLKKALSLDDGGAYRERLEVALHRLELRAELYKQPERAEDQATMIIEQARKSDSGTIRMKRSLLCRAGEALAPDAFLLVLDSESETKAGGSEGKGPLTIFKKLAAKARQFMNSISKAEGHLKRLGNENDRERAQLWADLAKTARKQEVWDVCRVASRFCLLYDDGRWKNVVPVRAETPKRRQRLQTQEQTAPDAAADGEDASPRNINRQASSRPSTPTQLIPLYEKDLVRTLAEVNFINGEASVHLLRSEGIQLGDSPIPPEDKSKRPKGYVAKKPEEDPDWLDYCDWIKMLSDTATNSFLRSIDLGVELNESWVVCSATAYLWNYNNHILTQNRHREITDTLHAMLDGLKKVGHAGETSLLTNICTALAYANLQPWLPAPAPVETEQSEPKAPRDKSPPKSAGKRGKKDAPSPMKMKSSTAVAISPDAQPDLKKALDACTYGLDATKGENPADIVPIGIRHPLLQMWVLTRQMLQQQISKMLGTDDLENMEGQRPMTRALVALEMLTLNGNGIMEFKEGPGLMETINLVEPCDWSDKLVELQVWTRLAYLAYELKDHSAVVKTSNRALEFAAKGTQRKDRKLDSHKCMVEQEMMSIASCLLGQSLMENMLGKNAIRRQAMEAFLNSARYGHTAGNYKLVINAARHYWNACMALVSQPIERELLKEPIRIILECVADVAAQAKKEAEQLAALPGANLKVAVGAPGGPAGTALPVGIPAPPTHDTSEDLTLRAALYGVLFQSYSDKGEWEESIKSMDEAVNAMPRTNHRLLIFKHRVIIKAKLGRSVQMDIQKFRDESEDHVANMWRRVALCSKEKIAQLVGYQNAIEALSVPANDWQKCDYLIEFGQWLYCNEFPLVEAMDQLEWAADILLNMQFEKEKKEPSAKGKKGKKSKTSVAEGKKGSKSAVQPAGKGDKAIAEEAKDHGRKTPDTTAASENESEINAADYIPVVKKAVIGDKNVIGCLPSNASLALNDLSDIQQLETLFRTHTLMVQVAGRDSPNFADLCLTAYGYIIRMWQVSMAAAGPVMKEIAKNPPLAEAASGKGSAKKPPKGKEKEPVKEKPKRKGPLDHVPHSTEEWAVYDVPDEAIEAFKHPDIKGAGINEKTIKKPTLTFHYLEKLIGFLRDIGYNHLTLPVLAFAELLSRHVIKNRALNTLVHLRSAEVCIELNLHNGMTFHEKLAGPPHINDEEQAKCREEIAVWKEKQAQVKKEELRVRASLASLAKETKTKKLPTLKSKADLKTEENKDEENTNHMGKKMGDVVMREVWTQTAEVLIRQGMYKPARDMLNEAHQAAIAFEDKALIARILFNFGVMAYHEAQFGQAANFIREAQMTDHGDEMFWYKMVCQTVEAMLRDVSLKEPKRQARGYLKYALSVFSDVCDDRLNKLSITGFIVAKLEAKFASIQVDMAKEKMQASIFRKAQEKQSLLSACQKFQDCTERLLKLCYLRDAILVMKEHAGVLHYLAKYNYTDQEEQHQLYLQSLEVMKEAVRLSDHILYDVQTLMSIQNNRHVSLPVQREATDTKLMCADLMLDMFQVYAEEDRSLRVNETRKGSVQKMVEELVRQTPNYTPLTRQWIETTRLLADSALLQLVNTHSLAGSISRQKAKSLYLLGRCLRLLHMFKGPDAPSLWDVQDMNFVKISNTALDQDETEEPEIDPNTKEYVRYSKLIQNMKANLESCHHYLVQASDCLGQAINLSLQKGYRDICGPASLELVECCGQFDPNLTSNLLALHQSCQTSLKLEEILHRAQPDPTTCQQAALLHQRYLLLQNDVTTNFSSGPVFKSIISALEKESIAWKRLGVSPSHLDLMKDLPANFNVIILQHSPCRNYLYGAVFDKPKQSGRGGNPKHQTLQGPSKSRVVRVNTSPEKLDMLLNKFRQYKHDVMQILLKQEYQRTQVAMRQKMLENLEEGLKGSTSHLMEEDHRTEEVELQEEFKLLLEDLEEYLLPFTTQFDLVFRPPTSTSASNSINPGKEPPPSNEAIILLCDQWLMELPLEALKVIQFETIISVTRDFSLQLMSHRMYIEPEDPADKKKKEKDKPPSRIPGLREAGLKKAKVIPLDRQVPQGCLPVNTSDFRYVVDPRLDCAETEKNAPIEIFNQVLEKHEQQFTARWLGVMGDDHTPSAGEYELYMTEGSAFVYYGMERFLAQISPEKIAALNIPECLFVAMFDLAQTSKSFLTQSKVDINKTIDSLSLEKPNNAAMLLSLIGTKTVMLNQWHCTLAENGKRLDEMMQDLLAGGKTMGQALRLQYTPMQRPVEAEEGQEMAEVGNDEEMDEPVAGSEVEPEEDGINLEESAAENSPDRNLYNMVCYGLPNIMVTLVN